MQNWGDTSNWSSWSGHDRWPLRQGPLRLRKRPGKVPSTVGKLISLTVRALSTCPPKTIRCEAPVAARARLAATTPPPRPRALSKAAKICPPYASSIPVQVNRLFPTFLPPHSLKEIRIAEHNHKTGVELPHSLSTISCTAIASSQEAFTLGVVEVVLLVVLYFSASISIS